MVAATMRLDRYDGDRRCERHQAEDDRTEAPAEHARGTPGAPRGRAAPRVRALPAQTTSETRSREPHHLGLHGRERELRVPPVEAVLDHHEPDRDGEQGEDDAEARCDHVRRRASEPVGEEGAFATVDRDRRGVGRRAVECGCRPSVRPIAAAAVRERRAARSRTGHPRRRGRRAGRRRCQPPVPPPVPPPPPPGGFTDPCRMRSTVPGVVDHGLGGAGDGVDCMA